MRKMLKEGGPPPTGRWADLAVLEPVKDYKARHASTLLVFDAVEAALAKAEAKQRGGGCAAPGLRMPVMALQRRTRAQAAAKASPRRRSTPIAGR